MASDDDLAEGDVSKSRGGSNKDPCWALVECIPIETSNRSKKKTNVVCSLCRCSIGTYVGKVKVERFRKHFTEKRCPASSDTGAAPTPPASSHRKEKSITSRFSADQREAFKINLAAFLLETGVPLSCIESHELR